jgi:hypothetical protein
MLAIAKWVEERAVLLATSTAISWTIPPQARNGGVKLRRIATIITPKATSGCSAT